MENEEVQTVGEMLRNARTKQNKTIDEIADELCIRKFYLNAIENMDFANIPPMPYGLGFIRSYAKFLGLNSDRIVSSYRQIMTGEEEAPTIHEHNDSKNSAPRFKHVLLGIFGLVVLGVAWSVFPTSPRFEDNTDDNIVVIPEPVIVEDEREPSATLATQESEEETENSEAVSSEEKHNDNISDAEKITTEQEVSEVKQDKQEDKTEENSAAVLQMKIVLTGPSWLELRQGKKVLLNGVYNKGYTYTLPSEKGLVISVGRPRNVRFYLGNEQVAVVSNLKRKNISLDKYFQTTN